MAGAEALSGLLASGSSRLCCLRIAVDTVLSEVQRPDHHGGGAQGVAGPLKVVPLDAVQLPVVLPRSVKHPV